MEYRALPTAHTDAWRRLVKYAFSPEEGPDFDTDEDRDSPAEFARRGLYDVGGRDDRPPTTAGGRGETDVEFGPLDSEPDAGGDGNDASAAPAVDTLAAACGLYDFRLRIRGAYRRVGGVSAVASPPETRRRGHVGAMLEGVHRELRREGVAFAALWPFNYEFYRRFGYGQVGQWAETTVPPDELSAVAAAPSGQFRRLDAADTDAVARVYDEWASAPLAMDRTDDWWRLRVFDSWRRRPYVYGWSRDGALRSYVVYSIDQREEDGGSDDKRLQVYEAAAVDHEARDQLYRFCRDHDSQVGSVAFRHSIAEARALQTRLTDPRAASVEVKPGGMIRTVDAAAAVDALVFPRDADGQVTLAIDDDACPWNDGVFVLSVADGAGDLQPVDTVDSSGSTTAVDVRLDVAAFAQLLVGATDAATLAERDRIRPGSADADRDPGGDGSPKSAPTVRGTADNDDRRRTAQAVATLDQLCPPADRPPRLREGF
jgi:predicted acetyltransferase